MAWPARLADTGQLSAAGHIEQSARCRSVSASLPSPDGLPLPSRYTGRPAPNGAPTCGPARMQYLFLLQSQPNGAEDGGMGIAFEVTQHQRLLTVGQNPFHRSLGILLILGSGVETSRN